MTAAVATWGGRRAQRMVALVLAVYGDVCHLCGHAGAESADHLTPRSMAPELTWSLDNLRPAHHAPCPSCGVRCNVVRSDRALPATRPPFVDAVDWIDA